MKEKLLVKYSPPIGQLGMKPLITVLFLENCLIIGLFVLIIATAAYRVQKARKKQLRLSN